MYEGSVSVPWSETHELEWGQSAYLSAFGSHSQDLTCVIYINDKAVAEDSGNTVSCQTYLFFIAPPEPDEAGE